MSERAVYKSTAAEYLDDLFSGTPEELARAYEQSLELMASIGDAPLAEAVSKLADAGELPEDAVEDSTKGGRAGRTVDRIIGSAYREAIELARRRDEPVPIETLW